VFSRLKRLTHALPTVLGEEQEGQPVQLAVFVVAAVRESPPPLAASGPHPPLVIRASVGLFWDNRWSLVSNKLALLASCLKEFVKRA